MRFDRVVRVRDGAGAGAVLGHPLLRAGGALRQLPLEAEQVLEEVVAPLRRRRGPGDFEAAGDRVAALAGAEAVAPAEALRLEAGRLRARRRRVEAGAGAVRLAEGVAAGDQRDGLLVVHRHAAEGLADVVRRGDRVGIAVGAFGVDVDEAHLHGGERVLEVARVRRLAVVVLHEHAVAFSTPGEPCE